MHRSAIFKVFDLSGHSPISKHWPLLAISALLICLCVMARLLPHDPNFTPLAATALFAGFLMKNRFHAAFAPLLAMAVSDLVIGFYDWRVMLTVYASITVPAFWGHLARSRYAPFAVAGLLVAGSVLFFGLTNLSVWLFSAMYPLTVEGLARCYTAALPFFEHTLRGDLFWGFVLFGTYWLAQAISLNSDRLLNFVLRTGIP